MFVDFARILYYPSSLYFTSAYLPIQTAWPKEFESKTTLNAHALPSAIFQYVFTLHRRKNTVRSRKSFGISLCSNQSAKKNRALSNIIDYLLLTVDLLFNYLIIFYRLLGALCGVAKHTKHITATDTDGAHDSRLSCWANNKLNLKTKGTAWTHAERYAISILPDSNLYLRVMRISWWI